MTPNIEQHCQMLEDNYTETTVFDEYQEDDCEAENQEDDDWKRLARYISGIVLFFYVLFKYLI